MRGPKMSSSMFKVKGAKIRQWNSDLQWVLSNKESCRKVEVTILHHRVDPGNIRQHFCKCKHAACLDEFGTIWWLIMVEIPWCSTWGSSLSCVTAGLVLDKERRIGVDCLSVMLEVKGRQFFIWYSYDTLCVFICKYTIKKEQPRFVMFSCASSILHLPWCCWGRQDICRKKRVLVSDAKRMTPYDSIERDKVCSLGWICKPSWRYIWRYIKVYT